jgi:hypothetical protein
MPYENEYASYGPLRRIAESDRVQDLLGRQRVDRTLEQAATPSASLPRFSPDDDADPWQPDLVLAIDGSHHEEAVENGFPGAEVSYITVAGVLLDMKKVRELDQHRPVDPVKFRETEAPSSVDSAFPGCNVIIDDEVSARSSLRKVLYETLESKRASSGGESLLETYEALLQHKPDSSYPQRCPYTRDDDCIEDDKEYERGRGVYSCPCRFKRNLYSTDALRIHERMAPAGSNGEIFGEIMQVLERLWMIHLLRSLEQEGLLPILGNLAVVIDGPLAIFGQPAWLSQAIADELARLNEAVRRETGDDLLMLGVEKGGLFVDHLENLDTDERGAPDQLPRSEALLIDDPYIKENIIFSDSDKPYGEHTYFGRKFFYKTKSGALIVVSLPFLREQHRAMDRATPKQFARLEDTLAVLDQLASSRYPNALSPLISAHAEAAIPLNLGEQILAEIARRLMKENS